MPMIDLYIPEGALAPMNEDRLVGELVDILIRAEGFDPTDEKIRGVTWTFLHRPKVYRAEKRVDMPVYKIVPTVPEGQYDDEARAQLVKDVTEAVARAEGANITDVGSRVWVFPSEIPDGGWGSRGVIRRLPDIMEYFHGADGRETGVQRLAAKRRRDGAENLETLTTAVRQAGLSRPAAAKGKAAPDTC